MHCFVKQIIQTLRVNDHQCVFLTNQQAEEENDWLSTAFARSRDYPSEKFALKRKSDKVPCYNFVHQAISSTWAGLSL